MVGTACGLGIEGSGWVAAPDIVVTNAHVVAGESDTRVEANGDAPGLPAEALDFDPRDDIAVLRVPGLAVHSLSIAPSAPPGISGAILGYPQDGPFNAQPGRIGQTRDVETENAYGQGPVLRSVTELRGLVRPGNSGGPVISSRGQVLATVFAAIASPGSRHGGFAVPNNLVRTQLRRAKARSGPVADRGVRGVSSWCGSRAGGGARGTRRGRDWACEHILGRLRPGKSRNTPVPRQRYCASCSDSEHFSQRPPEMGKALRLLPAKRPQFLAL